eukprot:gene2045-2367_t
MSSPFAHLGESGIEALGAEQLDTAEKMVDPHLNDILNENYPESSVYENQEVAAGVLAELSHIVAHGNVVCAHQKLAWAVQHLQAQSKELAAEGAMAALMLITNVMAPRIGSPLCFDTFEELAVGTFKVYAAFPDQPNVRQVGRTCL